MPEGHKSAVEVAIEATNRIRQEEIAQIKLSLTKTIETFSPRGGSGSVRERKRALIETGMQELSRRVRELGMDLEQKSLAIIELKLARYLQRHDQVPVLDLADAIFETPGFIYDVKGSFERLLEIHTQKTLLQIAERRKRLADRGDQDISNPYEAVFPTDSGDYYLARLLNMPHLEDESEYMRHCVGNSDRYLSRIKSGEIVIFSLRKNQGRNVVTRHRVKADKDTPVVTFEYDVKTGTIEQIKGSNNKMISGDEPYMPDILQVLRQLPQTLGENGKPYIINGIRADEILSLDVPDGHVFTLSGFVDLEKYNPDTNGKIFKTGKLDLLAASDRLVIKLIESMSGLEIYQQQLAREPFDINDHTLVYAGLIDERLFQHWSPSIKLLISPRLVARFSLTGEKKTIEPFSGEGLVQEVSLGNADASNILQTLRKHEIDVNPGFISSLTQDGSVQRDRQSETLVELRLGDIGFKTDGIRTSQIYARVAELGLAPCSYTAVGRYRLAHLDQTSRYEMHALMPIDDDRSVEYDDIGERTCEIVLNAYQHKYVYKYDPGSHHFWRRSDVFLFAIPQSVSR